MSCCFNISMDLHKLSNISNYVFWSLMYHPSNSEIIKISTISTSCYFFCRTFHYCTCPSVYTRSSWYRSFKMLLILIILSAWPDPTNGPRALLHYHFWKYSVSSQPPSRPSKSIVTILHAPLFCHFWFLFRYTHNYPLKPPSPPALRDQEVLIHLFPSQFSETHSIILYVQTLTGLFHNCTWKL